MGKKKFARKAVRQSRGMVSFDFETKQFVFSSGFSVQFKDRHMFLAVFKACNPLDVSQLDDQNIDVAGTFQHRHSFLYHK